MYYMGDKDFENVMRLRFQIFLSQSCNGTKNFYVHNLVKVVSSFINGQGFPPKLLGEKFLQPTLWQLKKLSACIFSHTTYLKIILCNTRGWSYKQPHNGLE